MNRLRRAWFLVFAVTLLSGLAPLAAQPVAGPAAGPPSAAAASASPVIAMPAYTAADAVRGLYRHHLPPLAERFAADARTLTETATALAADCDSPTRRATVRGAWLAALTAWQSLATPAIGPVLERRLQRRIDFWPTRPALIQRAVRQQPDALADLARIGTPARGFPALEWLLRQPPDPDRCRYIALLAREIDDEAGQLARDFADPARLIGGVAVPPGGDAATTPPASAIGERFHEWINQWLGGWERLRWTAIEQPVRKSMTRGKPPEFARHDAEARLADWRSQWQALQAQAMLSPQTRREPPRAGSALVPIEALLLGQGRIDLAARWTAALDQVGAAIAALDETSGDAAPGAGSASRPGATGSGNAQWLELARRMKAVTAMFQNEVAGALDVPLGFSDADGD